MYQTCSSVLLVVLIFSLELSLQFPSSEIRLSADYAHLRRLTSIKVLTGGSAPSK